MSKTNLSQSELYSQQVREIKKRFTSMNQTLSLAESCTGGLLSAVIASESGVSEFFLGSVVSYNKSVKDKILHVPMTLIQVLGEVSTPVALAMAKGAREAMSSSWALAITGIAGPGGGSVEKPVGTVCFAIVGPGVEHSETQYFGANLSRAEIQHLAVARALELLMT